ncbi:MIP transporter [Penicillium alfredii]|uniref:MIP transporter n=1 Tax=Penicillium alfredii TaxID=1506179 RepID=A0A9W9F9Z3_9EURO|nr:MIP transporter [Penicillium alfredii]KAJ5096338.1 MIP transporter [Penicillium alfredii]
MDEGDTRQSRATTGTREEAEPLASSPARGSARGLANDGDFISPSRRAPTTDETQGSASIPRRSSVVSRRSGGTPSLAPRTTLADRTQGKFTLGGPEEAPQLRRSQEPFVQPGYAELNPSYDQPVNAKPVWSLAKPLPRVVRSGMVPTKEELLETRANAQLPAHNSQRLGLDVDPNDLEKGQIGKSMNPRKMAAQVEDARLQRESNLMSKLLSGESTSLGRSSRLSRASSTRRRRSSAWDVPHDQLSTVDETESQAASDTPQGHPGLSYEPLRPVAEEPLPGTDDEPDTDIDLLALKEGDYPEDLHPLVEELVEDEVHNNHTTWSVIRTHHREALAEGLAVYVQLTIGFCADLAVTVANAGNPNSTAWAWGFATMMAIYISGGVSGAHLNPAVTVMLWFYRGFPKRKMPEYFIAQFLPAFCAALTAYALYYHSIQSYVGTNPDDAGIVASFVTGQREMWVAPTTAFFTEFLGTVFLAITILALGDDQNAPPGSGMNALIIGLVITCLSIAFAFQTGAALNPSRDFGPRLALLLLGYDWDLFTNPYWFYGPWVGSLTGAFVGGFLYDFMIFTGGESPVNYPLERTQRAMRKSRMKWRRRLGLAKEKPTDRVML